ncbi:MAG TPA: C39 family peptidase [Anaerolineaceae bacterium]|nr:C39 family peptidase [Anaerolineaceae bacterium]
MTEPERAALEHIRQVVDSVLGAPESSHLPAGDDQAQKVSLLPVPYVSQVGEGAEQTNNDTGAAAGAMLVQAYTGKPITPNDFYQQSSQKSDLPLTLQQISTVLTSHGVAVDQRSKLKLAELALILATGRPALLLVKYSVLQQAGLAPETYNGAHYLVAVGMDVRDVYVHDPFRYDTSGQGQAIPWLVLYQAWTQAPDFERAALVPRQPLLRRVCVTSATLKIHKEPAEAAPVAGTARAGDVYEVTAIQDGWGNVGEELWINLKHVTDI